MDEFYRIKRLPPYVFEQVNQLKARLRAEGADVIDFGMGNPDMATPKHIADKLIETVGKPHTNRYSASRGIPGLRKAMARYYQRRFGVSLNPDSEVIATLGSKEAFANLAQAITGPGDIILAPDPAYPIHAYGFIIAGGLVQAVPAQTPELYLNNIVTALETILPKPKILVVNYPSNPTAHVVDLEFYKEIIGLAEKHDLLVLSDLAYGEIYFDQPPPSILQVKGARERAVEVNSLSKTYAMAGYRVGMAVGNETMIAALGRVKSYLDYGAFTPIQVAAAHALDGPQACVEDMREIYRKRRDCVVAHFGRVGWQIPPSQASMFLWSPIPEPFAHLGSLAFSSRLMDDAHIAVAPGVGFGDGGEGYVRIGLVENEQRIRQAAKNLKKLFQHHA